MKRRDFLKATLVTAGALVVGACDDGGSDGGGGSTGGGGGAGGGGSGGMGGAGGSGDDRIYEAGERFFPQSVASGDPRPDGVILWARAVNPDDAAAAVALELQVARDEAFAQRVALGAASALTAEAAWDHCVKARVVGLEPGTTYYYRFVSQVGDTWYTSRTGRTRTAPAADADVPVTFAVASCQDYIGSYYNTWRHLATLELDFVLHLGDYVYETTGNPEFQDADSPRVVTFSHPEEAIVFNAGEEREFRAARSLSNYRDLYKTYRGDVDLQNVHEKYAFVAVWDDHEYSDDAWGATATYYDGEQPELDEARKKAANQAWFEYMPVDFPSGPDFEYDPAVAYPDDLRIYRDLGFGKHMHLVLTDLRTYRADHLIPEDAFPGAVALTEQQVSVVGAPETYRPLLVPVVDIATHSGGAYATRLQEAGVPAEVLNGLFSVPWVNSRVVDSNEGRPPAEQLAPIDPAGLPLGLAWHQFGKLGRYSSLGSRYLVIEPPFRLYAAARYAQDPASQHILGDAQERWFLDTMGGSDRTWKIWGSEYTVTRRRVDLRTAAPAPFNNLFLLSAEDWDGVPDRRNALLDALGATPNVVALTGDIHAFFAGTPTSETSPDRRIVELVGGAISSGTYLDLLLRQARSDPALAAAGAEALAAAAEFFVADPMARPNPTLAYAKMDRHGFVTVVVDGAKLEGTFHQIAREEVRTRQEPGALAGKFERIRFKVDAGSPELYRDFSGTWKRWDPTAYDWV